METNIAEVRNAAGTGQPAADTVIFKSLIFKELSLFSILFKQCLRVKETLTAIFSENRIACFHAILKRYIFHTG